MSEERRRPGRPRSTAVEEAILRAALQLMAEVGYDAMSVEAIASRAGTGKATIYRRWPSKEAIVIDAIQRTFAQVQFPDTGSARHDLEAVMTRIYKAITGAVGQGSTSRVLASLLANPPLTRVWWERAVLPARQQLRALLERGVARGELRADLDVQLALDMVPGTMIFRVITADIQGPPTPAFIRDVADALYRGLAASPSRSSGAA
jgi:AcrR family transcriptional regulator